MGEDGRHGTTDNPPRPGRGGVGAARRRGGPRGVQPPAGDHERRSGARPGQGGVRRVRRLGRPAHHRPRAVPRRSGGGRPAARAAGRAARGDRAGAGRDHRGAGAAGARRPVAHDRGHRRGDERGRGRRRARAGGRAGRVPHPRRAGHRPLHRRAAGRGHAGVRVHPASPRAASRSRPPLLADGLGGWRPALASWAAIGAVALAGWLAWGRPGAPAAGPAPAVGGSVLASPLAWTVTAFFGLQAFVAFSVMNWLPLALMDRGVTRTEAGFLLGVLSIVALPVSLLVPPLAGRARGQSGWILGLSACGAAGLSGLLFVPTDGPWQALPWVLLVGLGMSVFSLALTVIALRASTAERTASLSGMAQGIGYVIAGIGPFLSGLLHEATGGWDVPFAVLLAVVVAQSVTGALAGRPRTI
ncbi:MAG TPA: MFS transporter [Pseudonocardia sp.]|uniref:MFS transporter n=1 Tax=Pseudonocardia sp. TaxID=60912 RepID=UPI002B4B2405|nr:MFS transporter [Pseudonocardia sp.]HLU54080.1 MFS transporter [Pseudonocardia sp.]